MELYHRQSIRLPGYDYSQQGWYFVTLCAHNRECLFGTIDDETVVSNWVGNLITKTWLSLPNHHLVVLDTFQMMPNHIHFIVSLSGGSRPAPTVGMIVGFLKSESTKCIRSVGATRGSPSKNQIIWQRNYYEHIIRNEKEYWAIRQYIVNNPMNWNDDNLFV